jgi:hypothetical protein
MHLAALRHLLGARCLGRNGYLLILRFTPRGFHRLRLDTTRSSNPIQNGVVEVFSRLASQTDNLRRTTRTAWRKASSPAQNEAFTTRAVDAAEALFLGKGQQLIGTPRCLSLQGVGLEAF